MISQSNTSGRIRAAVVRRSPSLLFSLTAVLAAGYAESAWGQGCVQSRGAGAGTMMHGDDLYLPEGGWQASISHRWLHSDRHFVGSKEQTHRQAEGSEVINDSHFVDLTATYAVNRRWSLNLTLPFVYSDRSSKYEHRRPGQVANNDTDPRYHNQAGGLGDVRLTAAYWVFNPDEHHDGNISLGLGIKAPTGNYEATDTRYWPTGPVSRYVDQSIQPGDGGWGVVLEVQGFQKVFENTYAYAQGSYLINPQEKSPAPSTGFSIPDSYLLRAGLSYSVWPTQGLSLSLGGRMEGVPVRDWIGGSQGSRRPGYAISIEPGVTWVHGKWSATVTVPVALDRNRERSVPDMASRSHGDAAFADYIITSSIAYRF